MWIRISKEYLFEYVDVPLVKYYVHRSQLSNNVELMISGIEAMLKKYVGFFASDRKSQSGRYYLLGRLYCDKGDLKSGRAALLNAIKNRPLRVKQYLTFLLSLLGAENFGKTKKFWTRFREM